MREYIRCARAERSKVIYSRVHTEKMSLYDGLEVETAPIPEISPMEKDSDSPAAQECKALPSIIGL